MTQATYRAGLEGVVAAQTRLSSVDGQAGELILAGYPVEMLAPAVTFEEVLYLLWHDRLPDAAALAALRQALAERRALPTVTLELLRAVAAVGTPVMDALRSVEVRMSNSGRDGFQLTFAVAQDAVVDSSLVASGLLEPPCRIVVTLVMGVMPEVLVDGVVTDLQYGPSPQPGESTLHVTGEDLTLMMDLEDQNRTFESRPDSATLNSASRHAPATTKMSDTVPITSSDGPVCAWYARNAGATPNDTRSASESSSLPNALL